MKNLANCTPREFLVQSNKIKKSVEKWLTVTDIMSIRKDMSDVPDDVTGEERKDLLVKQAKKNLSTIFDAVLDQHPDETLDLLAMLCFIDPSDIDNYTMSDLLLSVNELINDEAVIGFFTSLARLGVFDT